MGEIIKAVLIGAFIIIGISVLGSALWEIISFWVDYDIEKHYKRIKFSQFRNLFSIAPEKWGMYSNSVAYYRDYEHGSGYEHFSFSLIDLIKYRKFYKSFNQGEKERKDTERMRDIVEEWQTDIDKYKAKYGLSHGGKNERISEN